MDTLVISPIKKTLYLNLPQNRLLKVNVGISKTNHTYWSITGTLYTKTKKLPKKSNDVIEHGGKFYEFDMGGCIHDEILKRMPRMKPFVDLHLSCEDGIPMHAIESGFYYYSNPEKYKPDVLMRHLRIGEDEAKELTSRMDNSHNPKIELASFVNSQRERWKQESKEAYAVLINMQTE